MLNTKIMTLCSKFFICIFLYPFLSLNSLSRIYEISTRATLELKGKLDTKESNSPIITVYYELSSLEIKKYWEMVDDGNVILFFDIKSLNWRKISDLKFQNNFEKKFDILTENSYWIPFGSKDKKYFEGKEEFRDNKVNISLADNKLDFKTKENLLFTGEGRLAIYLKPNYDSFVGEIYKGQTEYSYKNDQKGTVKKISRAPNFYFLDDKKSEITVVRYQSIDTNKDNEIDFPYQSETFTANVGDTVYYKVEIINNMEESIYNLNITNPIGDYSKLSFGDRLFTGKGYPIVEFENGDIKEITNYPTQERGGKLEFFLLELKPMEKIKIYYCVEIVR